MCGLQFYGHKTVMDLKASWEPKRAILLTVECTEPEKLEQRIR